MKTKQSICEICGEKSNFDSGVLLNFGSGVTVDIEVCESCAEKIQNMILPYFYRCPICGETVRSGKPIDMTCICSGAPVPLTLVEEPKTVVTTWRVYATAENYLEGLLENEGYCLDEACGGYVIKDSETNEVVAEGSVQPMDLNDVANWVESHFPYMDS